MTQSSSPVVLELQEQPLSGTALLALTQAVLERRARIRFQATGGSMWPTLRDGDLLTLAPLNRASSRLGDVVAFVQPGNGKLAVHRVVATTSEQCLIQGDHAPCADGWVLKSAILGRVVRAERNGRRVRLGLGGERYGIAWLNRSGLLQPVLSFGARATRFLLRCAQSSVIYRRLVRRVSRHAVVRPASAKDVRRAYAWLNATSPAASPAQDQPEVTDFVAEVGNQLAGFVQLVYHPPDHAPYVGYWLFSLNVRARYRGAGIGETLTCAVMAKAKNDGAGELRLLVYSDNLPAIRLYHKLGFRETVVAGLQPQLAEEAAQTGRRRIVMQIDLQRLRR